MKKQQLHFLTLGTQAPSLSPIIPPTICLIGEEEELKSQYISTPQ